MEQILKIFLARYIISQRGCRLLLHDGFTYYKNRVFGAKTRWRCSSHSSKRCNARVFTIEEEIIVIKSLHNHLRPNVSKLAM